MQCDEKSLFLDTNDTNKLVMSETRAFMIKFARFPRNAGIEYPIHSVLRKSRCDYHVALHAIELNIITWLIDDTACGGS